MTTVVVVVVVVTAAVIRTVVVVAVIFMTASKYSPNSYTKFNFCGFLYVGISVLQPPSFVTVM